jgi:hypothetical protein
MIAWALLHALYAAALALIAYGLGRLVLRRLPPSPLSTAASTALGLGILGEALFLLASMGWLTRGAVLALLVISSLAIRPVKPPMILLATAPAFVLALYPPTGFDATMYHLPFARLFAETGRLAFADTLRFPVFPQLGELLFSAALLVTDDVTAQLTQWLSLAVTTIAVAAIARELAGDRAATLAPALWLGTPLALYLGGNAYIDCTLTMFVTLAFGAWLEWKRTAHIGWAALAGAFAGFAASTKYHGLFFVLAVLLALRRAGVPPASRRASRPSEDSAAGADSAARDVPRLAGGTPALLALLIAAPWYARIWAETGSPLFPYFSSLFGRHEWQTTLDRQMETAAVPAIDPLGRALFDPIAQGMAPHSPWVLLLLPFAVFAAVREPRLRFPLGAALVYALLVSPLDWRFMIAVVPLIAIGIAVGLLRASPSLRNTRPAVVIAIASILAAPGLGWATLLIIKYGAIPATQEARDRFLSRRIAVYDALRFLRDRGDRPVVYLLHAENAAYYCPARCLGEHYGPYRYDKLPLDDPRQLAATLRRFGVQVLVVDRASDTPPRFPRLFTGGRAEALEVPFR